MGFSWFSIVLQKYEIRQHFLPLHHVKKPVLPFYPIGSYLVFN